MEYKIEIRGLEEIEKSLRNSGKAAIRAANQALETCAQDAHNDSVDNAPKSPTKAEYSKTLKRKKVTDRKNFYPGGLEKSIEYQVKDGVAVIFVRGNSLAGKYAKRIHDEKGKTWHHRGPGTIAKGRQADEKFIERAIRNNEARFTSIIERELGKALGKI